MDLAQRARNDISDGYLKSIQVFEPHEQYQEYSPGFVALSHYSSVTSCEIGDLQDAGWRFIRVEVRDGEPVAIFEPPEGAMAYREEVGECEPPDQDPHEIAPRTNADVPPGETRPRFK